MLKYFKISWSFIIVSGFLPLHTFSQSSFVQEGNASYYADKFHDRPTANGERYDKNKLTAAHLTLPFNTYLKVTNPANNKSVIVRVNDRGPFVNDRIIDLSFAAAKELDILTTGITRVKIEKVNPAEKMIDEKTVENNTLAPETVTPVKTTNKPGNEFYRINSNRIEPSGFGIQIGSYAELANILRIVENLERNHNQKITIQVTPVNDTKMYRLILGSYPDRKSAESGKERLKKEFPGCFVLDLGKQP